MSGHQPEPEDVGEQLRESLSEPESWAGGMGVRDTSPVPAEDDPPPEQSEGGPEEKPEGLDPAAGYPAMDPRSEDKPFQNG